MYRKQVNSGRIQLSATNGCCPDGSNESCKFLFTIADLATITSITIDGNVHTITATDETDPGDIAQAIHDAMVAEGYFTDGEYPTINVYLETNLDTLHVIEIYAQADSITMVTDPVATINGTEYCIPTTTCRYEFTLPVGEAFSKNLSDADVELANPADSPQVLNGTFATGAANDVYTEVVLEFGELYANETNEVLKRVKVVENLSTALFEVQVWLYGNRKPAIDDVLITKCECKQDYTVAQA